MFTCCRGALQGSALKKAQAQQEALAEAMKECTFKPKTNEGKRRELIKQMLDAADSDLGCLGA